MNKDNSYSFNLVNLEYPVTEIKCVDKRWVRIVYDDGRVVKYFYNKVVSEG